MQGDATPDCALPFFEPHHIELATTYSAWAVEHFAEFESDEGGDGIAARRIFELLASGGWLRHSIPGAENGRLDLRAICLMREISAYCSVIADVGISEPWLGILPVALFGSKMQKAELLPAYLSGTILPAFALSEPEAGSDAAAIATSASRGETHYVLNGRKTWTSNSGVADLYVVFAREKHNGAISAFLVPGDQQGIAIERRLNVLSPHTVATWTLDACDIPTGNLVGEVGAGYRIALSALACFRPTVGAAAVGIARRALAEALARSQERTAFKRPISEFQIIQAKLSDMATMIEAARLLVYRAAWQHDVSGEIGVKEAAMAKLYATEAAFDVVDEAVQIFGGLGVLHGQTVERLYRHVRAYRIFDGTSEIQKLIIAREVLKGAASSPP